MSVPVASTPTPTPTPTTHAQHREGWFEQWLGETAFLRRYPHYAGIVSRMDPIATRAVETMAVALRRWDDPNARIQLLINREYFRHNPSFRSGILLHEIQHIVLGHLLLPKFHVVGHPRLMEIAMELSANESIEEPLPGGIHIPMFTQLGILPGQSTMERYAILAEAYECGELEIMDWWSSRMLDVHRPRRQGCPGSGSGLGDFLDARSDGGSARNWNRSRRWGLGAPTMPHEIERMKRMIAEHLRGEKGGDDDLIRSGRRRVAKEIDRVILTSNNKPMLDWRRVLHEAFPRRRLIHPDYLKPNRRFPTRIGEIPGRTRRPPKPPLLVGIDTSGSMSVDTLGMIAREIVQLGRHAKLTIVECDAAVHRMYPLSGPLGPFIGGGDTDFSPVFDASSARFDGVVYFTDGRGEFPSFPSLSKRAVLWIITHTDPFEPPFGRVARLPFTD